MKAWPHEKQENIVNLARCAWAGSQRYGALIWSGDIDSSFESLRNQLAAGLNMGLAGIPWWTTDIGGFHGGVNNDPSFRECLIRWFQFATFSPVLRMHGDREPHSKPLSTTGGGKCVSGAPNELWSFGDEVYAILGKISAPARAPASLYPRLDVRRSHEWQSDYPAVVLRFSRRRTSLGHRGCLYVRAGCARRTYSV